MTLNIGANLQRYSPDRTPTARYASFDYCYNYFRAYHERAKWASWRLTGTCRRPAFSSASISRAWGMLPGSSVLLQRSARHNFPVVEANGRAPAAAWVIDAGDYSGEVCDVLMDTAQRIRRAFAEPASDILVTKIMLGVFGCVPAFDSCFKRGFGVWTFSCSSLGKVAQFYREHSQLIESNRVATLDFVSGQPTPRNYSRAKVIDMIFFVEGGRA